ncbi:MAG: lytic murein transglycosylase [Actinobacteria bacterium]|nr:lytic murein transglycosylase [Actinomycetota bacterium]
MRTKIATIAVLVALLGVVALAGASLAGADSVSGNSATGTPVPQGATTTTPIPTTPACSNGVDDDGDGLVDMEDPDCESPRDNTEEPPPSSAGTTTGPGTTTTTPETTTPAAPPTTTTPTAPSGKKPEKGQTGEGAEAGEELRHGETIGGGRQPERRGGVVHNQDLGDSSGGGSGGGAGAVKAPSATGDGDQPLGEEEAGNGGSQFNEGGEPTLANPTTTIAPFGPAPIGVPNFVIDSFEIPPFLLPIYQACGTEYGIPWEVLAAINKIETNFGTNLNVSSAGAVGWMQFLPSSWEMYGLDANGDGRKDPYNPVDAICAAAHYLKLAGGDHDLYKAIFAYNHADWYVQEVLLYARAYGKLPSTLVGSLTGLTEGAHFPVAANSRYADDVAARAAIAKAGGDASISSSAAEIISSSPTERGINIFAAKGAPVVAVNDGVIRKLGRTAALGKFVVLEDTYGNRYTYAELGRLVRNHRSIVLSDGEEEQLPTETQSLRPRLRALPDRSEGGAGASAAGSPKRASRGPGRREAGTEVQPAEGKLRVGSKVIAGTILGHVGGAENGVDPHLNFSIRPAGKGAPLIDPKPILDGWKLLEATAIYRAKGKNPFNKRLSGAGVLLLSKEALEQRVLADKGLEIYSCGREDIETGQIDRRVLAVLEYLRAKGFSELTITALKCGHSYLTTSGNVSEHSTGDAVDIAEIDNVPVTGHQGPGTLTDQLIKDVLQLQGTMEPHQVISLENLPGEVSFAMPDHYDHVHIGFRPIESGSPFESQSTALLDPNQWQRLIQRLSQIENPQVPIHPSKFSEPDRSAKKGPGSGIFSSGETAGED